MCISARLPRFHSTGNIVFLFAQQHENLNYPDTKKNGMPMIIKLSYIRVFLCHSKPSCHIWYRGHAKKLYTISPKRTMVVKYTD